MDQDKTFTRRETKIKDGAAIKDDLAIKDDAAIVELYWQRDEKAIRETKRKYGNYLAKIAYNILHNYEDSQESVNDAYLRAWNAIPPYRPPILRVFLSRLTRLTAIDIYRKEHSLKRGGSEYAISLSELEEVVACSEQFDSPADSLDRQILADSISGYLATLNEQAQAMFLSRYYFMDSIKEIAANFDASESLVKSQLHRTRQGLRKHLESEGYINESR